MSLGFAGLSPLLKKRTVIVENRLASGLFSHTRREQVEKRFGGDHPDLIGNFWPPVVPNFDF